MGGIVAGEDGGGVRVRVLDRPNSVGRISGSPTLHSPNCEDYVKKSAFRMARPQAVKSSRAERYGSASGPTFGTAVAEFLALSHLRDWFLPENHSPTRFPTA